MTVCFAGMSWGGTWSSGTGFTWLNPTSDKLGVGLNTTPAEKAQIVGGNILIDNTRNYKGKTGVGTNSIDLIGASGTTASIYDNKISVLSSGWVGIGYTNPAANLDVNGDISASGEIVCGSNVYAGAYLECNLDAIIAGGASVSGDLNVYGTKNFVQIHPTDPTKQIVYVAAEAGEALTMVRGNARTTNGSAIVRLPEHFSLVTSDEAPLTVQLTVEKVPALIYLVSKSKNEIEVKIKPSDYNEYRDVDFSYFVQGVRDGFEDHQAIQDVDPSKKPALSEKHRLLNARKDQVTAAFRPHHRRVH
ncbi:MAG: hypothetical protein JWO30_2250 [Fibrobacteres bacterium]|nr:hypothetical protein [Fibrobacterota bacterium]